VSLFRFYSNNYHCVVFGKKKSYTRAMHLVWCLLKLTGLPMLNIQLITLHPEKYFPLYRSSLLHALFFSASNCNLAHVILSAGDIVRPTPLESHCLSVSTNQCPSLTLNSNWSLNYLPKKCSKNFWFSTNRDLGGLSFMT
jgi:hypothetical protein